MIIEGIGRFDQQETTHITKNRTSFTTRRHSSPVLDMISDALEFPCIELSRCYLTEKDRGRRLTLATNSSKRLEAEESLRIEFTKSRRKEDQWYVKLETITTEEGNPMRVLQLRHTTTGKYLHATADGKVGTQDFPSQWTTWLMEPVASTSYAADDGHGPLQVCYHLLPKAFAPRALSYTVEYTLEGEVIQLATTDSGTPAVWELEFTSGELCFLSNPVMHSQIRCSPFGKLSLSSVFQGWEVFRFIEVGLGQVAISSWSHSHKYLSSDPDGGVSTTENRLGHWEKWKLEKVEHGVYISSVAHPNRYLTVGKEEGEPLCTTTRPSVYSIWHLDAAHSNTYFLISASETEKPVVSNSRRGPFLTKNRHSWEEWTMERQTDGYITLYSRVHEKYLGCNSTGGVHTTTTKGDWSLWEMEESPHGGIYLLSKAHQRHLAVQNSRLCTSEDSFTESETFRLEPRLPATISGPRLFALGTAGAVGVALSVAMPYAVLGVMEATGMAATELTVLAGLSIEAVAGFGGGALLGAGVVQKTASIVTDETQEPNLSPTHEAKEELVNSVQRPISAWRNW